MDSGATPAVRTDPVTGRKLFNTRAQPAGRIAGAGYSVVADAAKLTLPEARAGTAFDAEKQARYREFTEERRGC